ncbi:MAG: WecB/TagA/CpsF family glycosyltransferase [Patescibacteria group bacterium]|nr:WecB/TagA/CpsF family glycosyltransferase [Patescibacteria group bacterium]
MNYETHSIFGLNFARLSWQECDDQLDKILAGNKQIHILTANPEYIILADKEPRLKKVMESAGLLVVDGIGLIWAANFLDQIGSRNKINAITKFYFLLKTGLELLLQTKSSRRIFADRISGSDLWLKICAKCERLGLSVFLAGWEGGLSTFSEVKNKLQNKFPKLKIAGDFTGQSLGEKISKEKANVLFFCFGTPKQDYLLHEILFKIKSAKLGIGLGASFDFFIGKQKRAPEIMQRLNLEWLFRFIMRPKRNFKKILNSVFKFIALTLGQA